MSESVIQRSFAGGEIAPIIGARADLAKYTQAVKTCLNFLVRRPGGVSNRAGFRFVDATKDATAGKRLMRYVPSDVDVSDVLIEIGSGYFRFYRDGAQVEISAPAAWSAVVNYVPGDLVSQGGINYYAHTASLNQIPPNAGFWHPLTGDIYEIPTPYAAGDVFQWNQSGNVITLTHPSHQPRELIFSSLTSWVLQLVSTAPSLAAPTGGAGVAGVGGTRTFRYIITASRQETYEESVGSTPIVIAAAGDPTTIAPHALTWNAVGIAVEYSVYCDPYLNGVYGFIGTAATNAFNDVGFVPDFNVTPPIPRVLFTTTNNFPTSSAQYQQRRWFANTNVEPDSVFGSRTGFRSNFTISSPLQDDDAVTFRLAGNNHHPVRFLVAMKSGLILLTSGGEWVTVGAGGPKNPITPVSLDTEQETWVGVSATVKPLVIGNTLVYAQARDSQLFDLKFEQEVEGLGGRDLTLFATHLFSRKKATAMDYQRVPDSTIWCVRNDGVLLGLTFIPEEEIFGWHRHITQTNTIAGGSVPSLIEDVCVIREEEDDAVYVIVARVIGGATVRYIERMEQRNARQGFFNADTFFVDSGLSYSGAPANNFTGLDHLNGQVVAVLGDGGVVFNGDPTATNAADFVVTAGELTLTDSFSNVHIGLPIRYPDLETLDLDVGGSSVRDKKKSVQSVTLLVERSSRSFYAGVDENSLRQYLPSEWEPTSDEDTGPFELNITTEFNRNGRVLIRQKDPLPLTILGIIPNINLGG